MYYAIAPRLQNKISFHRFFFFFFFFHPLLLLLLFHRPSLPCDGNCKRFQFSNVILAEKNKFRERERERETHTHTHTHTHRSERTEREKGQSQLIFPPLNRHKKGRTASPRCFSQETHRQIPAKGLTHTHTQKKIFNSTGKNKKILRANTCSIQPALDTYLHLYLYKSSHYGFRISSGNEGNGEKGGGLEGALQRCHLNRWPLIVSRLLRYHHR